MILWHAIQILHPFAPYSTISKYSKRDALPDRVRNAIDFLTAPSQLYLHPSRCPDLSLPNIPLNWTLDRSDIFQSIYQRLRPVSPGLDSPNRLTNQLGSLEDNHEIEPRIPCPHGLCIAPACNAIAMSWFSILPAHLTIVETWIARIFVSHPFSRLAPS